MIKTVVASALLALSLSSAYAESPYKIYILAGQSNMAGTAKGKGPKPNKNILNLGLDRQLRVAKEPLSDPKGAVDRILADQKTGVGPGLFFANEMKEKIILVPCALGRSSMRDWDNEAALFTTMMERVDTVLELEPHSEVAGVLFWQGDTDSSQEKDVALWAERFAGFVKGVRARYQNVPVVFVQVTGNAEVLREQMRYLQAEISIPNVLMVSSDDLTLGPSNDLNNYRVMGRRMAAAIKHLRTAATP